MGARLYASTISFDNDSTTWLTCCGQDVRSGQVLGGVGLDASGTFTCGSR